MAMSRSLGWRCVTSSPPMAMVPSVTSSSLGDHAQQRRLAAAGRPDEHEELAVGDVEVDRVDGEVRPS